MGSAAAATGRWIAFPAAAVVFAAGVWVAGGVLTDSFRASMALVALWYAVAGAATLAAGLRRRALRAPLWAGYGVAALAVGAFLAWTTLRDRVVHERLPAGVTLGSGRFVGAEHATRGSASVVRGRDGSRRLALRALDTSPGPDLRVRIVPGDSDDGGATGAVDLGALKGNIGDQQYAIPDGADVADATVVIWCRAFSAAFGSARLAAA